MISLTIIRSNMSYFVQSYFNPTQQTPSSSSPPSRKSPSITTPPHIRHLRLSNTALDLFFPLPLTNGIRRLDSRALELGHELAQSRLWFGLVVGLWALLVGLDIDVLLSDWFWLVCGRRGRGLILLGWLGLLAVRVLFDR